MSRIVDLFDNILVTDTNNNKLQLLDSQLRHLGDVTQLSTQHKLTSPLRLCFDNFDNLLYISESDSHNKTLLVVKL